MREGQSITNGPDKQGQGLNILLLEDNPADVRLLIEAFQELSLHPHIEVAEDGEQALALLQQWKQRSGVSRPDLLMLDLRVPKKSGLAVLAEVRADPTLQDLPAIVLTSSLATTDQQKAMTLGVERFLHKPMDLEEFFLIAQDIVEWWQRRQGETSPQAFPPPDHLRPTNDETRLKGYRIQE